MKPDQFSSILVLLALETWWQRVCIVLDIRLAANVWGKNILYIMLSVSRVSDCMSQIEFAVICECWLMPRFHTEEHCNTPDDRQSQNQLCFWRCLQSGRTIATKTCKKSPPPPGHNFLVYGPMQIVLFTQLNVPNNEGPLQEWLLSLHIETARG